MMTRFVLILDVLFSNMYLIALELFVGADIIESESHSSLQILSLLSELSSSILIIRA